MPKIEMIIFYQNPILNVGIYNFWFTNLNNNKIWNFKVNEYIFRALNYQHKFWILTTQMLKYTLIISEIFIAQSKTCFLNTLLLYREQCIHMSVFDKLHLSESHTLWWGKVSGQAGNGINVCFSFIKVLENLFKAGNVFFFHYLWPHLYHINS